MVKIHVEGCPRDESNVLACVHTARNAFCTTSAASSRSRTMRSASE